MRRYGAPLLLLLAGGLLQAQPSSELEARIQRVEQGLRPAVWVNNRPVPRWTIDERLKFYKVPGVSVAVIAKGKVEWARGYGVVAEGGRAVDAETLFQAASISKPVASMVALHLVDMGKLSLDEDVNSKLRSWKVPENEFTKTQKVTLRRLLNHSAGLTVHGFGGYATDVPVPTLVDILEGRKPANSAPVRVDITPGTKWRYAGGGYEVMQQLVADVTGRPFPEVAQEFVLGPLGMSHSTYRQPLPAELATNAAAGHRGSGAMIGGRWHVYPEMTAAGLWTTPSDLARVILELETGGHVLRPETQREMLTKVMGEYGLGIGLGETDGHKAFSHGGANEGFRCMLFGYRNDGMGAVVMTNGDAGSALADEILRSIAAEYGWADYKMQTRAAVAVAPDVLESYTGKYLLGPMEVTITREGDRLFAEAQGNKVELFPDSAASFFATQAGIPPIRFGHASDGSVEMLVGEGRAKRQPLAAK